MIWLVFLSTGVTVLAERPHVDADGFRQVSLQADGPASFLDLWRRSSAKEQHHHKVQPQSWQQEAMTGTANDETKTEKATTGTANDETKTEKESPPNKGSNPDDQEISDPAPPREEDAEIPGSQTWKQAKEMNTCELREAYPCGPKLIHCCCRFGCEFVENIDKCDKCKDDAAIVKANMIPASQLWEKRVKEGICNAARSHPCGPGCCCNAGWSWSKELRICQSEEEKAAAKEKGSDNGQDKSGDSNESQSDDDGGGSGSSEKSFAKAAGGLGGALAIFLWAQVQV